MNNHYQKMIDSVILIARQAGDIILDVYNSEFDIYIKNDQSPLTEADKLAHKFISSKLKNIDPKIPILSEEGQNISYKYRSEWEYYWLVDPLDGTKEFINKNDDFTVNICLIKNNSPILGVVYAPVYNLLYWALEGIGAYKIDANNEKKIKVKGSLDIPVKITVSRSHPSLELNNFISQFSEYNLIPAGSSLKICTVAEGAVHLYPRLGPTMEWDTAASHIIMKEAGGELISIESKKPLFYNKNHLLNPNFIAGNNLFFKTLNY